MTLKLEENTMMIKTNEKLIEALLNLIKKFQSERALQKEFSNLIMSNKAFLDILSELDFEFINLSKNKRSVNFQQNY